MHCLINCVYLHIFEKNIFMMIVLKLAIVWFLFSFLKLLLWLHSLNRNQIIMPWHQACITVQSRSVCLLVYCMVTFQQRAQKHCPSFALLAFSAAEKSLQPFMCQTCPLCLLYVSWERSSLSILACPSNGETHPIGSRPKYLSHIPAEDGRLHEHGRTNMP